MNKYTITFHCLCPKNNQMIDYYLVIESKKMIYVEELKDYISDNFVESFHEPMADDLFCRFGGIQYMKANHHGVLIETFRK